MRVFTAVFAGLGALWSGVSFAENNVLLGTGLGAAIGSVVGHQIDHDSGAWVGGAVGAVTGASIASSNNTTRYVERDVYAYDNNDYGYNSYNAPRRDIYEVDRDYYQRPYQRPPVNVIVVDERRDHRRGHGNRHYERHHRGGQGYYNQGRNDGRTVVIVR